jgi:hypothetical protein
MGKGPVSGLYKNRENNPMQSRMPRLAALVLLRVKWSFVASPNLIPSRSN